MASTHRFLVLVVTAMVFFALALSFQLDDPGDLATHLHTIQQAIMALQRDKEDLHLENKRLHMDNEDLRSLFLKLRQEYESDKEDWRSLLLKLRQNQESAKEELDKVKMELTEVKLKLDNAEEEIVALKENPFYTLASEGTTNGSKNIKYDEQQSKREKLDSFRHKKNQIGQGGGPRKSHKMVQRKKPRIQTSSAMNKRLLSPGTNVATKTEPRISFSAHMNSGMQCLGDNQPFVFETVNNNEGGAYDSRSGIFACPVNGTYFFTASILSGRDDKIWADIVVNNVVKARLYAGGSTNVYHGAASNSLIVHCAKNDDVLVRHQAGTSHSQVYGFLYSHFAGFLLWTGSNSVSNTGVIVG